MIVKATREGLIGRMTSTGFLIDTVVPFVALPSTKAKGKFVKLENPTNGKKCYAIVLDVGPWNTDDDDYVFNGKRPQVENSPTDKSGRPDNNAGIDLSERVWHLLEMKTNSNVNWEFLPDL